MNPSLVLLQRTPRKQRHLGAENKLGRRGNFFLLNLLNLRLSHMLRGDTFLAGCRTRAPERESSPAHIANL